MAGDAIQTEARELADLLSAALTDTEALNRTVHARELVARSQGHMDMVKTLRKESLSMLDQGNQTLYAAYAVAADFLEFTVTGSASKTKEEEVS